MKIDHVDYDAALLAVAFSEMPSKDKERILKRVDDINGTLLKVSFKNLEAELKKHPKSANAHVDAHAWPTYPTELAYSGTSECYTKGGQYCGDSVVSFGRIAWADGMARRSLKQVDQFDNLIMAKLQAQLNSRTFMNERYLGDGTKAKWTVLRFFEYPSVIAMLLHDVRYGIDFGLGEVAIEPLLHLPVNFKYHIGNVHIDFDTNVGVDITAPIVGKRSLVVGSLQPKSSYVTRVNGQPVAETLADEAGRISGVVLHELRGHDRITVRKLVTKLLTGPLARACKSLISNANASRGTFAFTSYP